MIRKRLLILLIAFVFVFAGAPVTFADAECDHDWRNPGDEYDFCICDKCGETKAHNRVIEDITPATCYYPEMIFWVCQDCGQYYVQDGEYAPHQWSGVGWCIYRDGEEYADAEGDSTFCYGHTCYVCGFSEKVPKIIKKGKTKRLLPKRYLKGAKKKYVYYYSKKAVKATKNGKVKGKKRGARATIIWEIKYKKNGGPWWKSYEMDVIVK